MGHFVLSILTSSGNAGPRSLPAVSTVVQTQIQNDEDLKSVLDEKSLKLLKEEVGEKLMEDFSLTEKKGVNFELEIIKILNKIGW